MKILNHDYGKYITTQKFNKLLTDNFAARLKQANLASLVLAVVKNSTVNTVFLIRPMVKLPNLCFPNT